METKIKVSYEGKNQFRIHKEIGKGTLGNKKCHLIQDNHGVYFVVDNKNDFDTFAIIWSDLAKAMKNVAIKHLEKEKKEK